jgi:hypothetical protein
MRETRSSPVRPGLLAAGLSLVSCAGPLDFPPAPTCLNPDVLAFVGNQYGAIGRRAEIVRDSARQYPAASADTVRCTVYVRRVVYDNALYGGLPTIMFEPRFFRVRTLSQGFEVALDW